MALAQRTGMGLEDLRAVQLPAGFAPRGPKGGPRGAFQKSKPRAPQEEVV